VAGERYRIRRGGFRTQGEVRKALNRLRFPDRSGRRVVTVGQWLTAWSETRLRLRHSTARGYRSIIEHYPLPHLGKVPLADLDYKVVAGMFREGHTAGTYVSILPAGVRDVVENVAQLVLDHGLRVPGQRRSRRRFEAHSVVRMSAVA